jgi:hypothetical protein
MISPESKKVGPIVASNDPLCNPQINPGDPVATVNPTQENTNDLEGLLEQFREFIELVRLPPFNVTNGSLWMGVNGSLPGGGRQWEIRPLPNQLGQRLAQLDIDGSLFATAQAARQQIVIRSFKEAAKQSFETGRMMHITGECRDQ